MELEDSLLISRIHVASSLRGQRRGVRKQSDLCSCSSYNCSLGYNKRKEWIFILLVSFMKRGKGSNLYEVGKMKDCHTIVVDLTPCTGGGGTMCLLCEL